jgi:hypothetical protein
MLKAVVSKMSYMILMSSKAAIIHEYSGSNTATNMSAFAIKLPKIHFRQKYLTQGT